MPTWQIEVMPGVGAWSSHGKTFRPGIYTTDNHSLAQAASRVKGLRVTLADEADMMAFEEPENEQHEGEVTESFVAETEPVNLDMESLSGTNVVSIVAEVGTLPETEPETEPALPEEPETEPALPEEPEPEAESTPRVRRPRNS